MTLDGSVDQRRLLGRRIGLGLVGAVSVWFVITCIVHIAPGALGWSSARVADSPVSAPCAAELLRVRLRVERAWQVARLGATDPKARVAMASAFQAALHAGGALWDGPESVCRATSSDRAALGLMVRFERDHEVLLRREAAELVRMYQTVSSLTGSP